MIDIMLVSAVCKDIWKEIWNLLSTRDSEAHWLYVSQSKTDALELPPPPSNESKTWPRFLPSKKPNLKTPKGSLPLVLES